MEEMSMNLIIQIIILATATVGLIQVLRYKPKNKGNKADAMEKKESQNSSLRAYFEPFIGMLGIFAFMLTFPLFILLFTKVIGMIGSSNDSESKYKNKIELITFASDSLSIDSIIIDKSLIKYYSGFYNTIVAPSSSNTKNTLTDSLINICIKRDELKLAAIATSNFSSTRDKDEALIRIINKCIELENYEVANYCILNFSSTSKKNSESERLFNAIHESLKKELNSTKNIVHLADSANFESDTIK